MQRSITTALGVIGVSAYGLATLVNHWHRPSDVAAAILVACTWGYLAVAAIRTEERRQPVRDVGHRPGAASVILVMFSWNAEVPGADLTTAFIAYVGGVSAVLAVTCGGLGALLRLVDASRPIPRERERVELGGTVSAPAPMPPA